MAEMWGADPDALEQLAQRLGTSAQKIESMRTRLKGDLQRTTWTGRDADGFRQRWNGDHTRALTSAERFLREAGDELRRNARQQRDASSAASLGSAGSGGNGGGEGNGEKGEKGEKGTELDEALEDFAKWLKLLGITGGGAEQILALLKEMHLDPGLIKSLAENKGLAEALKAGGKVLDVVSVVTDFVTDYAAHPNLPSDERMVHAIAETAMKFAVGQGIEKASTWAGTAIGGALGFGAGAAPGAAIGWMIGQGLSMGFDAADGKWNVTEHGADAMLEMYKYAKAHNFDTNAMAIDLAKQGVGIAIDSAGNLVEGAGHAIGGAVSGAGHAITSHWH